MKVSGPAQLSLLLDRNLAWRKRELTHLKLMADSSASPTSDMLRRAGTAMMYAHWEGFVKDASKFYVSYLADSPVDPAKIKSCFVAIMLYSDIIQAGQARKKSVHARLVEQLRVLDAPPAKMRRMPTKGVFSTRSNLKGAALREITATLGLDYSSFVLKETPVINKLVDHRNTIAHGGGMPIPSSDYNALHSEVIVLLDTYRDLIQDAADNDKHLR
jgi:hypothetical protein